MHSDVVSPSNSAGPETRDEIAMHEFKARHGRGENM